jgi:hypothetical protein
MDAIRETREEKEETGPPTEVSLQPRPLIDVPGFEGLLQVRARLLLTTTGADAGAGAGAGAGAVTGAHHALRSEPPWWMFAIVHSCAVM